MIEFRLLYDECAEVDKRAERVVATKVPQATMNEINMRIILSAIMSRKTLFYNEKRKKKV